MFFQEHLETVVPGEGREVLILSGRHRGQVATLRSVNTDSFSATLRLESGEKVQLPYEQFSKRHVDWSSGQSVPVRGLAIVIWIREQAARYWYSEQTVPVRELIQ